MLHFRNLWLMSHKCKHMCTLHVDHLSTMTSKRVDTNLTISKQNQIFEEEKRRQIESVKRIEKIEVHYKGVPEDLTLYMNKALSTPFNVAQHISEVAVDRSALALVNGNPWDMHRPLQEECSLELIHFHDRDPFHLNKAFWRSCSFLLGYACQAVFSQHIPLQLHSFPPPNVQSGSFVYDIDLGGYQWNPTKEELMVISAKMHRLAEEEIPFERLVVDQLQAREMFSGNEHKLKQIPDIAKKSPSGTAVTLYRVKDHIDISSGPMMANTSFLGRRCTVAAAIPFEANGTSVYRFQGVALPKGIFLNHAAFGILEKRASRLNEANQLSAQSVTPS